MGQLISSGLETKKSMFFLPKGTKDMSFSTFTFVTFVNDEVFGPLARRVAYVTLPATKAKRYGWRAIMMWYNKELGKIAPGSAIGVQLSIFSGALTSRYGERISPIRRIFLNFYCNYDWRCWPCFFPPPPIISV